MKRPIVGFHQDEWGDWVATMECGHRQHVRHNPPFVSRPWVLTPGGRQERLGAALECPKCGQVSGAPMIGGGGASSGRGGIDATQGEKGTP